MTEPEHIGSIVQRVMEKQGVPIVGRTMQEMAIEATSRGLRLTHPCGAPIEAWETEAHPWHCQCQNDD